MPPTHLRVLIAVTSTREFARDTARDHGLAKDLVAFLNRQEGRYPLV